MKNLVVTVGNGVTDVGADEVSKLVQGWSKIAALVESKVKYINVGGEVSPLQLEWKLFIEWGQVGHSYRCEVSMTWPVNTDTGKVSVPIQTIEFELSKLGDFVWNEGDVAESPNPNSRSIEEMAEALSFGSFEREGKKFHYRKNWFPMIKRLGA